MSPLSSELCRYNFPYDKDSQGQQYRVKQVAPVIKEKSNEIVVITVTRSIFREREFL
jgi:hypothetical protein